MSADTTKAMRTLAHEMLADAARLKSSGQKDRARVVKGLARQLVSLSYSVDGWAMWREFDPPSAEQLPVQLDQKTAPTPPVEGAIQILRTAIGIPEEQHAHGLWVITHPSPRLVVRLRSWHPIDTSNLPERIGDWAVSVEDEVPAVACSGSQETS